MVAITHDSLAALRAALLRDTGYAAFGYLQEAGYAGGGALFEAFRGWLSARGSGEPEALSLDAFQQHAADFFRECGWGSLEVGELHEVVATLDSPDWGESSPGAGLATRMTCSGRVSRVWPRRAGSMSLSRASRRRA